MKYKFTGKTKKHFGVTLHQIVCITAFESVAAGDVGGWIEKESNLSQYDNSWVSGNARVYGDARVSGNGWVSGNAEVHGDAWVSGNAEVSGNAWVSGNARVSGNAELCTKQAYTISTEHHHVTITDTHITIGCQSRSIEFWRKAGKKEIEAIDGKESADTWMRYRSFILALEKERNGK